MNLDRVIAVRNAKTIYRDGKQCVKVFNENYSKADILNISVWRYGPNGCSTVTGMNANASPCWKIPAGITVFRLLSMLRAI